MVNVIFLSKDRMKNIFLNLFKAIKNKKVLIPVLLLLLLVIFIPVWAFFIEPNLLKVTYLSIKDPDLKGLRVAYISDFHACQNDEAYILKIIKTVNEHEPDLILLGGDYIVVKIFRNKSMEPERIATLLKGLKAKHGIYMIMGNHELHVSAFKRIAECLRNSNIKILQNNNTKIIINDKSVYIVGVGDISNKRHNIKKAFKNVEKPAIVFTHSPNVFPLLPDYVNITFAGHTHGGQVYVPGYGPLGKPTHYNGIYLKGFYESNGKTMFVSSGIGNSHLKVRFFNIPEIVIADFK